MLFGYLLWVCTHVWICISLEGVGFCSVIRMEFSISIQNEVPQSKFFGGTGMVVTFFITSL